VRRRYPDVHFAGFKAGEELAAHYAAADVFVFPSLTDTYGLVQLEALACGVPVAAFPVAGPRDVIGGTDVGVMDENLGRAIEQALRIPPDRCRAFALRFSWEACARQMTEALARIPRTPAPVAHEPAETARQTSAPSAKKQPV